MSLPSKREFLSQHTNPATGEPFAKFPSRGKFSLAAEAFAAENTDKWAAEAPKPAPAPRPAPAPAAPRPAVVATPRPVKVDTSQVDPKEVRSWAAANGHKVSDRGRLPHTVVAAFLKADGGSTTPAAPRPTPAIMPKRRPESTGYTVVGGNLIRQEKCGACITSVSRCACANGPQAHAFLSREYGAPLALTLDKPAL